MWFVMSSHYLDKTAEKALWDVITAYKKNFGIEMTFSQAVILLRNSFDKGDEKQLRDAEAREAQDVRDTHEY